MYGIDVWKKEARDVINQYPEKGAEFIDKQTKKLANKVRKRSPRGPTGNLKKSWRRSKAKEKKGIIRGEVKSTAPHAHLVEYGHRLVLVKKLRNGRKKEIEAGFVPGKHILQTSFNEVQADWDAELKVWFDALVKELEI